MDSHMIAICGQSEMDTTHKLGVSDPRPPIIDKFKTYTFVAKTKIGYDREDKEDYCYISRGILCWKTYQKVWYIKLEGLANQGYKQLWSLFEVIVKNMKEKNHPLPNDKRERTSINNIKILKLYREIDGALMSIVDTDTVINYKDVVNGF